MNSKSLIKNLKPEKFENIFEINKEEDKLSLNSGIKLEDKSGVYIFSLSEEICRLRGKTDILYIGATSSGLKSRIDKYLKANETQKTNLRISKFCKKLLLDGKRINLLFIKCENEKDPKKLESDLLKEFEEEHWELPPFNRQEGKS